MFAIAMHTSGQHIREVSECVSSIVQMYSQCPSENGRKVLQDKGTIYTVCYMFSQDADEVSDLFQEALVRLWQGFEGFEGRSDVRTWIYRVTLNTCISMDRKRRSRQTLPLEMDINLFEDRDEDTLQVNLLHRRIGLSLEELFTLAKEALNSDNDQDFRYFVR